MDNFPRAWCQCTAPHTGSTHKAQRHRQYTQGTAPHTGNTHKAQHHRQYTQGTAPHTGSTHKAQRHRQAIHTRHSATDSTRTAQHHHSICPSAFSSRLQQSVCVLGGLQPLKLLTGHAVRGCNGQQQSVHSTAATTSRVCMLQCMQPRLRGLHPDHMAGKGTVNQTTN
jgi:hypothetical protein